MLHGYPGGYIQQEQEESSPRYVQEQQEESSPRYCSSCSSSSSPRYCSSCSSPLLLGLRELKVRRRETEALRELKRREEK